MTARDVVLALVAGAVAFVVTAITVIEVLLPRMEFSVFVGLPAGIFVGAAVAALVLFAARGEAGSRALAYAVGSSAVAFVVAFAVLLFVVGVGVVLSLVAAIVGGVLAALVTYWRI